ncbi:unnamed protein product [Didymodactylos carnosus]|uniref:Helix-turn-helix domain-containing protein n=1 Tax=Didymodactylos carnosus TaxID=1234261 RepID=A0A816ENR9_9BILA|nr:unnamed protein product [Didymodactylos carnosus]CAF4573577.1 unnamed protein product [Didymodactylos carnosus]
MCQEKRFFSRTKQNFENRYVDVFCTSNESLDDINAILDEADCRHSNIKLIPQIGASVTFLDVLIKNENGQLSTSVYHKEAAEPCVFPFMSDHLRHTFNNIVQGTLCRAIRYSSTLKAFNHERRAIKLTLLYNG